MTNSLVNLTSAITKDSEDTVLEQELLKHREAILKALECGDDFVLVMPSGRKVVIRAKQEGAAAAAKR